MLMSMSKVFALHFYESNPSSSYVFATEVKEQRDINEACLVMATLRIPDHNTLRDDDVPVFVTGYRIHHRSNDLESMEDEDVVSDSTKCKMPFNISIKAVVAVFKAQTDYYHGMVL